MTKESLAALRAEASDMAVCVSPKSLRVLVRFGLAATVGLLVANCANQPQQRGYSGQQQREFGAFAHKKYGTASPRMYADTGEALPKGGGRDHTGRTYRVAGRSFTPHDRPVGSSQTGNASWYGAAFHGRKTANGEIYDRRSFSAAHPTMPLPSYARVTNQRNGYSVIVRVNDRGPYHGGRIMDVSERVAETLQFKSSGTGRVRVDYLGRAGIGGSDDVRLAQSLTMDGRPAVASYIPASFGENRGTQVAVAQAEPAVSTPPAMAAAFTPRRAPVAATPLPTETQPAEEVATTTARAAVAQPAAKANEATAQLPARAPLPPSRPFDLGGSGKPMKAAPAAQRTASLSFAPQNAKQQKANPLVNLAPARSVAGGKVVRTAQTN